MNSINGTTNYTSNNQNWFFLFHVRDDSISSELSVPFSLERGHIADWQERILLPEITIDPSWGEDQSEHEQKIDVRVKRRETRAN